MSDYIENLTEIHHEACDEANSLAHHVAYALDKLMPGADSFVIAQHAIAAINQYNMRRFVQEREAQPNFSLADSQRKDTRQTLPPGCVAVCEFAMPNRHGGQQCNNEAMAGWDCKREFCPIRPSIAAIKAREKVCK